MSAALLVADSGPLIALARLDHLHLPARYFEAVLVTATVWEEGVIPALRPTLDRLQATGYYSPNDLVAEVLAALGE